MVLTLRKWSRWSKKRIVDAKKINKMAEWRMKKTVKAWRERCIKNIYMGELTRVAEEMDEVMLKRRVFGFWSLKNDWNWRKNEMARVTA